MKNDDTVHSLLSTNWSFLLLRRLKDASDNEEKHSSQRNVVQLIRRLKLRRKQNPSSRLVSVNHAFSGHEVYHLPLRESTLLTAANVRITTYKRKSIIKEGEWEDTTYQLVIQHDAPPPDKVRDTRGSSCSSNTQATFTSVQVLRLYPATVRVHRTYINTITLYAT